MAEKMDYVYLVKIYDSTGRLLPVVTAFATRQGAEAYVHDFRENGSKRITRDFSKEKAWNNV